MVRSDGSRGDLRPYGPIGNAGDVPVAGDWNGDCVDSIGLYRPANSRFYLIWAPNVIQDIPYGTPNQDKPIIGDWDGDGVDTVGVYKPDGTFHRLSDELAYPPLRYGNHGDVPLAGAWFGDRSYPGVYRPGQRMFYRWAIAEPVGPFGNTGDIPLTGDWDSDDGDEVGVYRPANRTFYLHS